MNHFPLSSNALKLLGLMDRETSRLDCLDAAEYADAMVELMARGYAVLGGTLQAATFVLTDAGRLRARAR